MLYVGLTNLLFFFRLAVVDRLRVGQQIYPAVLFALFLFSAFRWQVGCDWSGYYNQYRLADMKDWINIFNEAEYLWWFVLKCLQVLNLPYPWANVISSGLFFIGVATLTKRQPDPLGFIVLLFPILIINMPMSGVRQGAAIGLFCLALCAFIDGKMWRYAFWIVAAAGFHASALLFIFLAPLVPNVWSQKRMVLAALLAFPGVYLLASTGSAEQASTRYIQGDREAFGAMFRVLLIFLTGVSYVLFLKSRWMRQFPNDYPLVTLSAFAMIVVAFLLPVSTIIADRLAYYFIPVQTMIFARVPFLHVGRMRQIYSMLPYISLIALFTVWALVSNHFHKCYLPYSTWLFGFPDGPILK